MIDRLHDILPHVEQLPPEAQEELATYIEALIEVLERKARARQYDRRALPNKKVAETWKDPAGAWSDLPDTFLEDLDDLRHANPPTPPIEEL